MTKLSRKPNITISRRENKISRKILVRNDGMALSAHHLRIFLQRIKIQYSRKTLCTL